MDARAGESVRGRRLEAWLQRERESGRFYRRLAIGIAAFQIAILAVSFVLLSRDAAPGTLLSPPLIALLLIANLIPAISLMALYARKVALTRAEEGGLGSGRLHTRLVVLFSVLAAVPTVIVAIFASLLFQSGLEFWFSDRARNMLENTVEIARASYEQEAERVVAETATAGNDLAEYLQELQRIDDPRFAEAFGRQVLIRNLSNEAIIFTIATKNEIRDPGAATPMIGPWIVRFLSTNSTTPRKNPVIVIDRRAHWRPYPSRLGPQHLSLRGARFRPSVSRST